MFEFALPDVGEGVAEGEIVQWHVEVGEVVEEDQVLAEVETDKAVVDVPSPVAGTVVERHAEVGEVVDVGDTLVTIDTGEEATAEDDGALEGDSAAADDGATDADGQSTGEQPAEQQAAATTAPVPDGRVFAPPHVRRLARELGVDLADVEGSDDGGRVTARDVREAAGATGAADADVADAITAVDESEGARGSSSGGDGAAGSVKSAVRRVTEEGEEAETRAGSSAETASATAAGRAADRDRTLATPATRRIARELDVDLDAVPTDETRDGEAVVTPDQVRAFAEAEAADTDAAETGTSGAAGVERPEASGAGSDHVAGRREPYRGVRRTIGQRMQESAFTAPHATHHDSVAVPALVEARAAMRERAAARDVDLTYMPFVLKAVVAGLREYPILNSELDEDAEEIVLKDDYHVGVATATDAGLMVPVVRNVDEKGILDLAAEVGDLTRQARERSIAAENLRGSTFTVTNFGAVGGEFATPIINYPETAILGLGGIEERPWVEDGEVVARPVLPLSLSIDHRVIDGAEAAAFANTVMEHLRTPSLLFADG